MLGLILTLPILLIGLAGIYLLMYYVLGFSLMTTIIVMVAITAIFGIISYVVNKLKWIIITAVIAGVALASSSLI